MDILLRESLFGRLINHVANDKALPYPEHAPDKEDQRGGQGTTEAGVEGDLCPRNWPKITKSFATVSVMLLNFSFYAASAIFTPSIPLIEDKFGATTSQGTLGLSLFVIAYGIGPLVVSQCSLSMEPTTHISFQLSPLSNLPSIGRSPVYVLGSLAFCLVNIGTALSRNVPTILGLRFLGGLVGSAPISVGGATLMEIYGPSQVPYAIAFYAVSGMCGPILGPVSTQAISNASRLTSPDYRYSGRVCDPPTSDVLS